ncbi:MAG: hypothetical protein E6G41_12965 [Actinobacteria bacterium]|nr:MAG: hypothetical protein E6G41_12965 [Actinomycetota bacterium]
MTRRLHLVALAAAALALTAGPAAADDFCVGGPGCEFQAIQPALDAAQANPGHDRVLIGPGAWAGSTVATGDVEIRGSGPATTIDGLVLGAGTTLEDATVAGAPALRVVAHTGAATVRRTRLIGRGGSVVSSESGALTIRDALIDARAPETGPALTTAAAEAAALHTVDVESATLLGHGQEAIEARAVDPADHVTVTLRDTVAAGFGADALARTGAGVANMSLDYVDVFPAAEVVQHAAGTLTTAAVLHVAPGFAADGITPAAGSPLIDAATPGGFGVGELDLLGDPRLAALGCGEARRDIGAVETAGSCRPRRHRTLRLRYVRRDGHYATRVIDAPLTVG